MSLSKACFQWEHCQICVWDLNHRQGLFWCLFQKTLGRKAVGRLAMRTYRGYREVRDFCSAARGSSLRCPNQESRVPLVGEAFCQHIKPPKLIQTYRPNFFTLRKYKGSSAGHKQRCQPCCCASIRSLCTFLAHKSADAYLRTSLGRYSRT